jgi:hypothetical protein
VPSPPPRATAIPRTVPAKVISVRTAVGRADVVRPPVPSRPPTTNLAAWNGPTAPTPLGPVTTGSTGAAPHAGTAPPRSAGTAPPRAAANAAPHVADLDLPTVEQQKIRARSARNPDPSRRPH